MLTSSGLILYICAGLLLSGGIILGSTTSWGLMRMSYYFWLSELGLELGGGIFFISGALLCIFICWVATNAPYHRKSLPLMSSLICLVSVSMLLLATGLTTMASLARSLRDSSVLNSSLLRVMSHDSFDYAVRSSFASMQIELKCCGVQSYNDWYQYRSTLPPSCCGRLWNKQGDTCTVPTHVNGCLQPALLELRSYMNSISVLAFSILIILSVTLISATYSLVNNIIGRDDVRETKQSVPLRYSCITAPVALTSYSITPTCRSPLATNNVLSPIPTPI